jgi:hypothetical protein
LVSFRSGLNFYPKCRPLDYSVVQRLLKEETIAMKEEKIKHLLGQFVADFGATLHAGMVVIGEQLGLYKAMRKAGPVTSAELANLTDTNERYVREWLNSQAAGGYVEYEAATGRYSLSEEQAFMLADEKSPAYLPGGFLVAVSALRAVPQIMERFRSGEGLGWHEHDHELFRGTECFFRPNYAANLLSSWIPSLNGVEAKLSKGARVADVGCGLGASTILMAEAFPQLSSDMTTTTPPSKEPASGPLRRESPTASHSKLPAPKIFPGGGMILWPSSIVCMIWVILWEPRPMCENLSLLMAPG